MSRVFELSCKECGKSFQKLMYPSWFKRGYATYCSQECASKGVWKIRSGGADPTGRKSVKAPGHPLANKNGKVLEYRKLLHDKIGPGEHPCAWCGDKVLWVNRHTDGLGAGSSHGELIVDHIDNNKLNNDIDNLVPSCNKCNTLRGLLHAWEERTGKDSSELKKKPSLVVDPGLVLAALVARTRDVLYEG